MLRRHADGLADWVRQAILEHNFLFSQLSVARKRVFLLRDRARAVITSWMSAREPAWSLGRKHWREIPVTNKYEYYCNEFFAMWVNLRMAERKLEIYFSSEEGRSLTSSELYREMKAQWPELGGRGTIPDVSITSRRWEQIFEFFKPRLLGVVEIIELLEELVFQITGGPKSQHEDLGTLIEQWDMLNKSEAKTTELAIKTEDVLHLSTLQK